MSVEALHLLAIYDNFTWQRRSHIALYHSLGVPLLLFEINAIEGDEAR